MRGPVQRGAGDIGAEDPQFPEQVLRRPGVALAAGFALDQRAVDAAAVGAAAVIIDGIDEKFKDEPDLLAFGRFGRDLGEEKLRGSVDLRLHPVQRGGFGGGAEGVFAAAADGGQGAAVFQPEEFRMVVI